MRVYLFFSLLLFLSACSGTNDEVYYRYNNVTIKRVDTNGKSQFFYMKNEKEIAQIWAEYSGINDGFSGYLKFEKSGKVLLFSGDGYFQSKGNQNDIFEYKRIIRDGTNYNLPNICRIWFPIETEQQKNRETLSKIKIKYSRFSKSEQ